VAKRIKHVVSESQVAHLWAHAGQDHANNPRHSFYFSGDTIYSYGGHFPAGVRYVRPANNRTRPRTPEAVYYFITTRTYSATTAGHVSCVRQAVQGLDNVFHVHDVTSSGPGSHRLHLNNFQVDIDISTQNFLRSKSAAKWSYNNLLSHIGERNRYARFFKCADKLPIPPAVRKVSKAKLAYATTWEANRTARNEATRATLQAAWDATNANIVALRETVAANTDRIREMWRGGADNAAIASAIAPANNTYQPDDLTSAIRDALQSSVAGLAFLRLKPGEPATIETSLGAEFPTEHGERAYRILATLHAHGRTYKANGHTLHVGAFQVDAMDESGLITGGCHKITWEEMTRFTVAVGWVAPAVE
jgi:hypothetical protein